MLAQVFSLILIPCFLGPKNAQNINNIHRPSSKVSTQKEDTLFALVF